MKLLDVATLAEARKKLHEIFEKDDRFSDEACEGDIPGKICKKDVLQSLGCVLARDVVSKESVPAFRKSTVDGYAVISKNTQGAGESIPVFLSMMEKVEIGKKPNVTVSDGSCAYVPTGGMLPEGADAVVMTEYCEMFGENELAIYNSVGKGSNVMDIGEDFKSGEILLEKGTKLRPKDIGLLCAAGVGKVAVFLPFDITVISTGDELVPPCENPQTGQTRDINTYLTVAQSMEQGFEVAGTFVLKDDEALLARTIKKSMEKSDIIVISGGSSKGEKDNTEKAIDAVSSPGVFVHGLALKPGKPTIIGYDEGSTTLILGLPGHPVAAMMVFELIAVWLWKDVTCQKDAANVTARMEIGISSAAGRETYLPVLLIEKDGEYIARPVIGKSGSISTMTNACGYTVIGMNKEGLKKDEIVKVVLI